jgi:hypothetical protein
MGYYRKILKWNYLIKYCHWTKSVSEDHSMELNREVYNYMEFDSSRWREWYHKQCLPTVIGQQV